MWSEKMLIKKLKRWIFFRRKGNPLIVAFSGKMKSVGNADMWTFYFSMVKPLLEDATHSKADQ